MPILTTAGNDRPLLADLYHSVIPRYAVHWESIEVLLGLEEHHIKNISKNNAYNPNRAVDGCTEMLNKWLKFDTTATWGKLDDAINLLIPSLTGAVADPHVRGKIYVIVIPRVPMVYLIYSTLACK